MQAIVLAGGKGQRLWPLSESLPKVMIPVAGKPVIQHHLEWLKKEGVTEVVITHGHLGEVVPKYLLSHQMHALEMGFSPPRKVVVFFRK